MNLPDDLRGLTSFELRAGVTAEDVAVEIENNLNCLDRDYYHYVREVQTRSIRYKVYKNGERMGIYVLGWDASGKVGHKPRGYPNDPALIQEWENIAWNMIWVSVLRKFGQLSNTVTPPPRQGDEVSGARKGGPLPTDPERKREIVIGWLKVRGKMTQESYCAHAGVGPSTLRGWTRDMRARGELPPS